MTLFSIADCFFGGSSGGSHLAAAFNVPAIIVIWRSLLRELRFPVSGLGITAAFLYPQHWFIAAEELIDGAFQTMLLERVLDEVHTFGRVGRPTSVGTHPRNPSGILPRAPARFVVAGNRRLKKVSGIYGSPPESNALQGIQIFARTQRKAP